MSVIVDKSAEAPIEECIFIVTPHNEGHKFEKVRQIISNFGALVSIDKPFVQAESLTCIHIYIW